MDNRKKCAAILTHSNHFFDLPCNAQIIFRRELMMYELAY
jgi:hypothetical protein